MKSISQPEGKMVIGIVDDDAIFQRTLQKRLEKLDRPQTVLCFPNGQKALAYLKNNTTKAEKLPDFLFLDIDMPVMNGFQFMDAYKALKHNLPKKTTIYMVTASMNREDIHRTHGINEVSEYLLKPLKEHDLKGLLKIAVDS